MTTNAAGEPTPSAAAGQAGWAEKLRRWLTRWWSQTPDGRTYLVVNELQRRWGAHRPGQPAGSQVPDTADLR